MAVICFPLMLGGLPCRDDTYDFVLASITMTNDTDTSFSSGADNQKSVFPNRVAWVIEEDSVGVVKNRGGIFKRDPMLAHIDTVFYFVPFKTYHTYIILII